MRLEQLEYLAAVSRHGSLRRASEHLHVSQPAVSEAISKLERELGVMLLERHRTGAKVSRAGQALLSPIGEVLDSVDRLRAVAADSPATARSLQLGAASTGAATLAVAAVGDLQSQHPTAVVEIRDLPQPELHLELAAGTVDLGLADLLDGEQAPGSAVDTRLLTGSVVAVIRARDALAEPASIAAGRLRRERVIGVRPGDVMQRFAQRLFDAGAPAQWHFAGSADTAKRMVAAGVGVALLPDYCVYGDPLERSGAIVARPVVGDRTTVTMVAQQRREPDPQPLVDDMVEHLLRRAGEAGRSSATFVLPVVREPRRWQPTVVRVDGSG